MMNYCKLYARQLDHIESFLTYADNNAIGYFAKQGFIRRELPQRKRPDTKKPKSTSNGVLSSETDTGKGTTRCF